MDQVRAAASALIDAPSNTIYAILADYRNEHPKILPQPYFRDLTVESGGYGAGTIFRTEVSVFSVTQQYHMTVSEPEPGRVLVETDMTTGLATTFTITAVQERQTRLEIATVWQAPDGVRGFVERLTTPFIMRRIYAKQLRLIADYAAKKHSESNICES